MGCRKASRVAAGALLLHGEAAPAVRKEAVDLQKMIQAAGGDTSAAEAGHISGNATSAHDSAAGVPSSVLLWARRHEALQSGVLLSPQSMDIHSPLQLFGIYWMEALVRL